MRIALGLQYDGSPYSGWQTQVNHKTVQDELEKALTAFVGQQSSTQFPIHTITAGRTDTGVHALGQVVHFDTNVEREDFSAAKKSIEEVLRVSNSVDPAITIEAQGLLAEISHRNT
jgi:tRNA pseudouridine(38-40) synthase